MQEHKGYKKCFIDVETTGTVRKQHHIWQLAGEIVDVDNTVLERFNFKFRPFSLEHIDLEAIAHSGITYDELYDLPMSSDEAFVEFQAILGRHCNKYDKNDKYQFVAYNANFDNEFLREWFSCYEDNFFGSWFFNPSICVMQAMAMFLLDVRHLIPNFKLGTLCECAGLGWDKSKAHDAMYDIEKTRELFEYVRIHSKVLGE